MNDVILNNLKKYGASNKKSVFALKNWMDRNIKTFKLVDALECIYLYAKGYPEEMTKIISQLTEKRKIYGRTQVYGSETFDQPDIVMDGRGKLELKGYKPDKPLQLKGQHMPDNPKIFRKSDNQVSKSYQNSVSKMMDFGKLVRKMYPDESNVFITHVMQAIKNYANEKKISPERVITRLKSGAVKLKGDDYNDFEIVAEGRTIIIREDVANEIGKRMEMTEYKFNNSIKKFLSDLLTDPVNAKPSGLLRSYGITRSRLLQMMLNVEMIERSERISDKDENGQPKEATMMVKFRVPKKNFDRKLKKLYIRLFERNLPDRKTQEVNINEDGEGATSADASGQFSQPVFPVQRRKIYRESEEIDETTATSNVGSYEYDVPFIGDKETLSRKNGVGGSVSINKA